MPITSRGGPYPAPGAAPNVPADIFVLAQWTTDELDDLDDRTTGLSSGVYTPALTPLLNVATAGAQPAPWTRIGDIVSVTGQLDVDPTLGSTTELNLSLPVASNFADETQLNGVAAQAGVGVGGTIQADASNDKARLSFPAQSGTAVIITYHFVYRVLP